jgi:hypothetical protein
VKVELDDAGAVAMAVRLQVQDRSIAILPNRGLDQESVRKAFVTEDLRMDAGD